MMKNTQLLAICFMCCLGGLLFFAVQQGWIIIKFPQESIIENYDTTHNVASKKKITLYAWHNENWHTESCESIWQESTAQNLQHLIGAWLTMLDEESIIQKKISLQTVMLDSSHYAYISFDKNPFNKDSTTHTKWMFIEGLLKTIRENNIKIQGVSILIHHQPLQDPHLDFSQFWPIHGFLE